MRIDAVRGVPFLGLDAIGSAAYGPEAALTILIPAGAAGLGHIEPLTGVILALLVILYLSYRQTIAAYPNGGGSYIVAKENLGTMAGLCAAAALILDYVLNVAVGISAGVGALVSAIPELHPYILPLALGILVLITLINLRGVRESAVTFAVPTYLFVVSFGVVLAVGVYKTVSAGGKPEPIVAPASLAATTTAVGLWLLLRAFASGCTAMTGVEAVSNGVPVFKDPNVVRAKHTLTAIVVILGCCLAGIAFLARAYHVGAMDQEKPGYQSVISALVAAIVGRGWMYYVTIGSLLAVLCLSANTSFADFPRLCRIVAGDGFLPRGFASVGRRLVFSIGIGVLATLSGFLLIIFGGITDRLIPLFAVGAFGAFTFSQAGMVVHWRRLGARKHLHHLVLNAVGAVVTTIALLVIIAAKFTSGAWITLVLIPLLIALFRLVHRHYEKVELQIARKRELELDRIEPPAFVLPVRAWDNPTEKALRFALALSEDVTAMHVFSEAQEKETLRDLWERYVEEPLRREGRPPVPLVSINSPYRLILKPLSEQLDRMRKRRTGTIAVILPSLVEGKWWQYLMHMNRANALRLMLVLKGHQHVVVITVPWYLERRRGKRAD